MNTERMEGNWKIFSGRVRERWGKLTDDDMDVIQGKRDQLAGRVQKAYGITKEDAQKQIDEFEKKL